MPESPFFEQTVYLMNQVAKNVKHCIAVPQETPTGFTILLLLKWRNYFAVDTVEIFFKWKRNKSIYNPEV